MNKYPNELNKESIKWLKTYGYTLNSEHEECKKLKVILKEHYPFQYYMWVDSDIKRESEEYAMRYQAVFKNQKEHWKVAKRRVREYKKKIIKEKYGLIK